MHNIKRKTVLLSLALSMSIGLVGCKNSKDEQNKDLSEYLIEISPSEKRKTSYETYTLELSDYSYTFGAIASAKYETTPVYAELPYGTPVLLGYSVHNHHNIKEGTPILSYRLEFDEVYMAEQSLSLKRKSERFEVYKTKEEKRLSEVAESVSQLPSDSEAFAEALEDYQEQLKSYNEYVEKTQEEIDELAKEVAAFEDNGKVFTIKSPFSGIVEIPYWINSLRDGQEIATIMNPYTDIYAVDNEFEYFTVGQKVIGDYSDPNGEKHTVEGRVLSTDSLLPLRLQSGSAYIRFEFPEDLETPPDSIHAVVETKRMKNVIRIPTSLVKNHEGAQYIELLTDEGITRKNIDVIMNADLDYIVLDETLAGAKVVKR